MSPAAASLAAAAAAPHILIYGDSWGSVANNDKALPSMLSRHNRSDVTVSSVAIGGTTACGWAGKGASNLADAVTQAGATHVWYTLGGNDMGNRQRISCMKKCGTAYDACQQKCDADFIPSVISCASTVLEPLWKQHPDVKVLNLFYDLPCLEGKCIPTSRGPSCGTNATCNIEGQVFWQTAYSNQLASMYPGKLTAINILGAAQAGGGDKKAKVGHPDVTKGSPCDLLSTGCVHPGVQGWVPITDAMWDLYWSKAL